MAYKPGEVGSKAHMWKPGQSGNPSGRPKGVKEVGDLARAECPEAIRRLVDWMRSDNAKASVAACNALLDRGYGKAPQYIEHGGAVGFFDALALALTNGSSVEAGASESSSGSVQ